MKQLSFELEVLTPLFMGGIESRLRPELRPPSIRGALRFWYRALIAGTILEDTDDRNALSKMESLVFGSTESGSPISVRVTPLAQPVIETYKKQKAIRTPDGGYLPTGRDYLFWSMAASGRPGSPRFQPDREYIKPGSSYRLTLSSRTNTDRLEYAAASLWLLSNLGALGSRARRCAGSIEVRLGSEKSGSWGISFKSCPGIPQLRDSIAAGVKACSEAIAEEGAQWKRFDENIPDYSVLAPGAANITIVGDTRDGWPTYEAALDGLGARLRNFRSHRTTGGIGGSDHDAVLDWFERDGERPPRIKRAAFGLPIPFRYSEGGPSDVLISTLGDRRGSPLHMRVTRLTTGRYVGVLVLFNTNFLKKGKELKLQSRHWQAPPPANLGVIQQFINSFPVKEAVPL